VRIIVSDSIQPHKTTVCILPSGVSHGLNLTAERRSMKAMQALLVGIPLVSPSWIHLCLETKKLVLPEASMYIRTLPTKIANSASFDFGVAFLAAALDFSRDYSSCHAPLRNVSVYLNGFSCQNETNFGALLRLAGANEVIVNKQTALSKVKALGNHKEHSSSGVQMVMMCNDSNVGISDALEREVRQHRAHVIVVNSQWLFDSVSCGRALSATVPYTPKDPKAKELYEITKE
jgi:hypothetical protein